jgi:predicted DNA-binding WGR domain protein
VNQSPSTDSKFPASSGLRRSARERNVARRYTVALSRDLFGASIVEFAWGRIGTKGQGRAVSFACEDEAARFARQLLRRRASAPKRIGVPYREVSLAP